MKLIHHLILGAVLGIWILYSGSLPETKASEEVQEVVQYKTERETHLYNKVEKTVDLPWFGDYQDLLASYAYNTCKKVVSDTWTYSCENLVKTWNAENGGWKWNAKNTANSNWTHDWGLCQLNSNYHLRFMKSEWFENPLAQLDYCLQVRIDAKNKWKMPWYAYNVRHKRDKGIKFLSSNAGIVHTPVVLNLYEIARQASIKRQNTEKALSTAILEEHKARKDCIDSKQCAN